jgi:hypothetical protein
MEQDLDRQVCGRIAILPESDQCVNGASPLNYKHLKLGARGIVRTLLEVITNHRGRSPCFGASVPAMASSAAGGSLEIRHLLPCVFVGVGADWGNEGWVFGLWRCGLAVRVVFRQAVIPPCTTARMAIPPTCPRPLPPGRATMGRAPNEHVGGSVVVAAAAWRSDSLARRTSPN